jgi:hypothetical protein
MRLTGDSVINLTPGVVGNLIEEAISGKTQSRVIIVLPETGKVIVLNEVGSRIWSLIDGKKTINEIASTIEMEYNHPSKNIHSDAIGFIEDLLEKGILREV